MTLYALQIAEVARLQLHVLFETASPLVLFRQLRCIGNVAALAELNDLSFSFVIPYDRKRSIGEVHGSLRKPVHTTCPADHVDEAALVAVCIRYAECVDKAMLEWRKALAEGFVETVV